MDKKILIRGALSFGLLILVLMQMDLGLLLHETGGLEVGLFSGAVLLMVAQIFFLTLRWHSYLNVGRVRIPFRTSMFINLAGYFANILFIASVGGILAKSGLAMRHGLSLVNAVFATMLDRFMTLAALLFFSAVSLPLLGHDVLDFKITLMLGMSIAFLVLAVLVLLLLLRSGLLRSFILSSRRRSRIVVALRNYTEDYGLMARTAVHSLIGQMCFILAVYVLSLGIDDNHASTLDFLALMPILALISSLPISFGGWGVREGAFVYGLGLIGFSMESAFLLSVQVGLASLIAPFVVGLPYILHEDFRSYLRSGGKGVLTQS